VSAIKFALEHRKAIVNAVDDTLIAGRSIAAVLALI
jgi:hypothetical protein